MRRRLHVCDKNCKSRVAQRFPRQQNPHRYPLTRRAFNGEAATRNSKQGAMRQQPSSRTCCGAVGGNDTDAIVGDEVSLSESTAGAVGWTFVSVSWNVTVSG